MLAGGTRTDGMRDLPDAADRRPDVDKSDTEVRMELAQLRDVWHSDQQELKKLHKVRAQGLAWCGLRQRCGVRHSEQQELESCGRFKKIYNDDDDDMHSVQPRDLAPP